MASYERSYATARTVFSIVEFIGWAVVFIGGLIGIIGFSTGGIFSTFAEEIPFLVRLIAAIPGISSVLLALVTIAVIQSSRANVDTAEMTRDILKLIRSIQPSSKDETESIIESTIDNSKHLNDRPTQPSPVSKTNTDLPLVTEDMKLEIKDILQNLELEISNHDGKFRINKKGETDTIFVALNERELHRYLIHSKK